MPMLILSQQIQFAYFSSGQRSAGEGIQVLHFLSPKKLDFVS